MNVRGMNQKSEFTFEYVQANRGRKKIHILFPFAANRITACRWCEDFVTVTKADWDKGDRCKWCEADKGFLTQISNHSTVLSFVEPKE